MKIALILSGLPRVWRECMPTQLAMAPDHELDVFFHFWNTVDADERAEILDTLRPRQHCFQDPLDFTFADTLPGLIRDRITVPSRMVAQWFSWRAAAMLFQPHLGTYDLAIRSRADLQFTRPITAWLDDLGPDRLGMTWFIRGESLSDTFAVGDPALVHWMHGLYDHIWTYRADTPFNPETMLGRHLQSYAKPFKLIVPEQPPYFVRRPYMTGWTVEQCLAEPMGVSKWRDPEVVQAHKEFFARERGAAGETHVDQFVAGQLRRQHN